jgi:ABC-type amino acid transport system permease subunit
MIKIVFDQKQAKDSWNVSQELINYHVSQRYGKVLLLSVRGGSGHNPEEL